MEAEAPGAPAAAPPAAAPGAAATPEATAQQQAPSAAERMDRGEAPVKQEFIRSVGARVHVGSVTGGGLAAAPGAAPGAGAESKVAAAGEGERQLDVRNKSKKQAKRVRAVAWWRAHVQVLFATFRACPAEAAATAACWGSRDALPPQPASIPRLQLPICRTGNSSGTAPQSCAPCLRWASALTATRAGEGQEQTA